MPPLTRISPGSRVRAVCICARLLAQPVAPTAIRMIALNFMPRSLPAFTATIPKVTNATRVNGGPMRLKQRPEDFSVKESFRFDEVPQGQHRVYLMDKQKLSTFDAIARIRDRFGLRPMAISYCGLKDK